MKFDGTNWVYVGNAGFSIKEARYISLAFSPADGQPYILYTDYNYANRATLMKFDGANWVYVGDPGFSKIAVFQKSLAINSLGEPYVAYPSHPMVHHS
jgi:hypothetical protein